MKTGLTGPIHRGNKVMVCNACDYMEEHTLFTARSHDRVGALCKHPARPYKPFGHSLELVGDSVLTPTDCPQPVQIETLTGNPV